jgi:hypothetical protein
VIAVWLAQRQRTFGRAGQRNCKPNQSENTKLPFAHATVKASPLRFDPLTRRLAPTIDSRSASGPGPHRPKRRTLPFWRHPCADAANFRQFTEFIGGKRLQDTSRLSGRKTFNLKPNGSFLDFASTQIEFRPHDLKLRLVRVARDSAEATCFIWGESFAPST